MTLKEKTSELFRKPATLLASAFFVRLICLLFSKNFYGDSPGRTLGAMEWLQSPFFVYHTNPVTSVWGPLHYYLMGLALAIYNDPLISPRLVSLIFGSLSILPFYGIAKIKFGHRAALYSAITFIFFTIQVKYTGQAASEAIFVFMMLSAVYYYFRFDSDKKIVYLVLTALFLNLAAMTRHDTIVFVPLLSLILLIKLKAFPPGRRILTVILFGIGSAVFALVWFWGDYITQGNPFYAVDLAKYYHQLQVNQNVNRFGFSTIQLYNLAFWPAVIFLSFTPVIAVLSLMGLVRSLKNRSQLDLEFIFILPFLFYTYQASFGAAMTPFARFSMTFSIFLLPFAGAEWQRIHDRLNSTNRFIFTSFVFCSIVLSFLVFAIFGQEGRGYVGEKFHSISPLTRLPYWDEDILNWTNANISKDEEIVIDYYRNEPYIIKLYTKLPRENITLIWANHEEVLQYIIENKVKYLIYSPRGRLSDYLKLNLENPVQVDKGIEFNLKFVTTYYGIFEILHKSEPSEFKDI